MNNIILGIAFHANAFRYVRKLSFTLIVMSTAHTHGYLTDPAVMPWMR
jgi:hypothetical protein